MWTAKSSWTYCAKCLPADSIRSRLARECICRCFVRAEKTCWARHALDGPGKSILTMCAFVDYGLSRFWARVPCRASLTARHARSAVCAWDAGYVALAGEDRTTKSSWTRVTRDLFTRAESSACTGQLNSLVNMRTIMPRWTNGARSLLPCRICPSTARTRRRCCRIWAV